MRLYMWNPAGRYISAEYVLPQIMVDEQKQDLGQTDAEIEDQHGLNGNMPTPEDDAVGLPRERMLADPVMREALERWSSGDDSAFRVADAALQVLLEAQDAIEG